MTCSGGLIFQVLLNYFSKLRSTPTAHGVSAEPHMTLLVNASFTMTTAYVAPAPSHRTRRRPCTRSLFDLLHTSFMTFVGEHASGFAIVAQVARITHIMELNLCQIGNGIRRATQLKMVNPRGLYACGIGIKD
jgi:hypothetical protein